MRFQHVLQKVYGEPWQITPAGWYAIHQIVLAHAGPGPESARPSKDLFGQDLDTMKIVNGIARIPIKGSIVKGASLLEKSCGAVSHEDIHSDLDQAEGERVKAIVLDFASPGGMVTGTAEVSSRIAALNKKIPVFAFTDELMCSAAYQMAAGAGKIFSTQSATIGSIGVIWEFYNVAGSLAQRGIAYDIFTSGPFKGTGHPARELSPEQRAWIQSHVDHLAAQFKSHVRSHRPQIAAASMHGQIFTGDQALKAGLVDELVPGIQAVFQKIDRNAGGRSDSGRAMFGLERVRAHFAKHPAGPSQTREERENAKLSGLERTRASFRK